ncbi:MAG: PDZ domain-containing protein [Cyanothece sp. SIO1E1]|nr:PDZ domain-containing protein [Cyanothece sp. SIO1E1]
MDTRAFLGVHSSEVSLAKAEILGFENPYGSYITQVIGNTAAELGGLEPFDYIYGIDDLRASRYEDLSDMLSAFQAGDEVVVHFYREGQEKSQLITLGSRTDAKYTNRNSDEDPHLGISDMQINPSQLGVKVDVSRSSTAADMGLEDGDVITAINGHSIVDWEDISTAIDAMSIGQTIEVEFERDGDMRTASAPIQSRAATQQQYKERIKVERNSGAFLGIYSNTLSREKAKKLGLDNYYGSYVTGVIGNTAAERAGIEPFDYIYGIDEYRTGARQNLGTILSKYEPGERARVYYIRKGSDRSTNITFGSRSEAVYKEVDKCDEPFFGVSGDHSRSWNKGVPVQVIAKSTAESLGMEDRDVILTINDYTIIDWDDISTAIDNMSVGENIKVTYMRDNRELTGIQAIKSYCETKGLSGIDQFNFGDREIVVTGIERKNSDRTFKAVDFTNVVVNVQDISQEESSKLRSVGGVRLGNNTLQVNNLELAPNPQKGLFKLRFNLPGSGSTRVQIFNDTGRNIYDYDLGNYSGSFEDEVDISQNGNADYFITVSQNNRVMAKKIVLRKS